MLALAHNLLQFHLHPLPLLLGAAHTPILHGYCSRSFFEQTSVQTFLLSTNVISEQKVCCASILRSSEKNPTALDSTRSPRWLKVSTWLMTTPCVSLQEILCQCSTSSMAHHLFKSLFYQAFCGAFLPQTEYCIQMGKEKKKSLFKHASFYFTLPKGEWKVCTWNSFLEHCLPQSLTSPALRRDSPQSCSLPQNVVQHQEGCKGLMRCSQGSFTTCALCFCLQVQNCCCREEIYMNKSSEVTHSQATSEKSTSPATKAFF